MPTTKRESDTFESLSAALQACEDTAALFKLANTDAFGNAAHQLAPDQLKTLRELYRRRKVDLDGKLKLEAFNGQIIRIVGCNFWHSDRFTKINPNATGDGVTLTYHPESQLERTCRSLTTSPVIFRFMRQQTSDGAKMPHEDRPIRALPELVPVRDAKRAAAGQRIWSIQRLPMPDEADGSENSPF